MPVKVLVGGVRYRITRIADAPPEAKPGVNPAEPNVTAGFGAKEDSLQKWTHDGTDQTANVVVTPPVP